MTSVSSQSKFQQLTLAFILFALFSPFIILALSGYGVSWPTSDALAQVLWTTFSQAFLSALFSVAFGIAGGMGLIWLSQKKNPHLLRIAQALALLPNAAPVLILLLAVIKFLPGLRGFVGIVGVHALLNMGIVAIAFARLSSEKLATAADLAWIEGAYSWQFVPHAFIMLKNEIVGLFLFVFALCFSSFAVPMVIGGSRATVIEVMIWEKLRIDGDWPQALGLSALQLLFILALSFILARENDHGKSIRPTRSPLMNYPLGILAAIVPGLLIIGSLLDRPWRGFMQIIENVQILDGIVLAFAGTLIVGTGVAILVSVSLCLIAYANPEGRVRKIMMGYAAPTSVLTGFAMLVLWRQYGLASYMKIIVAITLVSVPALYRLRLDAELRSVSMQRVIANTLGASSWITFARIVMPQLGPAIASLTGLATIWALGDFALSKVIAERDITLAMTIESLMGSYRLDIATTLITGMVIVGIVFYFAMKKYFAYFLAEDAPMKRRG